MSFNVPILIIAYKRPYNLIKVINSLRKLKPHKIYFAFDGPKNKQEKKRCLSTQLLVKTVDWESNIATNISQNNLGCKNRVSSAIDWFFEYEDMGIILEDDTLANYSFFHFCKYLLYKYQNNSQIMHISGNNFLFNDIKIKEDYYFSKIPHIWGWATWKRAWKLYDKNISSFPKFKKNNQIKSIFPKWIQQKMWLDFFQRTYDNKIDTWDYQWSYTLFKNNGIAINPSQNLVSNIGFSQDALNTTNVNSKFANMSTFTINKIIPPKKIIINTIADEYILKNNFGMTYYSFFKYKIKKIIGKYYYQLLLLKNKLLLKK